MAKTMYWYCQEWENSAIDANDGSGHYLNWFQDDEHSTPCNVAAGLPTSGDTVYGSNDGPICQLGGGRDWSGVHIAGGTFIFSNGTLTLSTASTVEAGATVRGDGSSNLVCGAKFNGDIDFYWGGETPRFGAITMSAGWKVNGGNAGGNVAIYGDGTLTMNAPGGVATFHNVRLVAGFGDLNAGGMGAFGITGSYSHDGGGFYTPPGTITLLDPGATANGVGVGHVPAIDKILPSDNLFGITGTAQASEEPPVEL
jgi:hypothetical protein